MSSINRTQKRRKRTRNKRGGKQSQEKVYIKDTLGIFHGTPDSYDPKSQGLKIYYTALLDIYNTIWKVLNLNDKKKLIKEIIGDRGYLSKLRHPLRTRVYNNLVTDLENLTLMNKEIERHVELGDFSGKTLKTVKSKKGEKVITCSFFNFKYCPSCSLLADKDFSKINSSDWFKEYDRHIPSKKQSELRFSRERSSSANKLERPMSPSLSPSSSPQPTSTGGKSKRRRTVKKYKK